MTNLSEDTYSKYWNHYLITDLFVWRKRKIHVYSHNCLDRTHDTSCHVEKARVIQESSTSYFQYKVSISLAFAYWPSSIFQKTYVRLSLLLYFFVGCVSACLFYSTANF